MKQKYYAKPKATDEYLDSSAYYPIKDKSYSNWEMKLSIVLRRVY